MSEVDPVPLAPGTLVAGKLRVVRMLGIGGMGAVYEVEHELTKHHRALKLLHAEMLAHPSVIARFEREASAAGRIANPHIVESFDAGKLDTGEPYLVMEMLQGQSLATLIEKRRQLSLAELCDIIGQACDGIQAAHDAGIVHRDLKPENLFLLDRGGKPFVKILDFGISKFDPSLTGGHGMTKEGAALGTPYYMSPEQVAGDPRIDARTDVYALGIILYECASGRRPFDAETLTALAVLIHEGKPTPLSTLRPDLPAQFCEMVHGAMAKDRERRFASVRELGRALAAFADASESGLSASTNAVPASAPQLTKAPAVAATNGAVSMSVSGEGSARTRKSGPLIAGAVATLAAVAVGAFMLTRRAPASEPAHAEPVVAAPVPSPPPLASVAATIAPLEALPSASPPLVAAPPAAVATQAAPSPQQRRSPSQHTVPATAAPTKTPTTRADQKGLANDNPFK